MPKSKTFKKRAFTFLPLAVILILLTVFSFSLFYINNQCKEVTTFSIGGVDSRFNVSSSAVKIAAKDAADRWNSQAGEKLLAYDEKSKLKINLIYDDRQAEIDKLNLEAKSLEQSRKSVEASGSNFDQLLKNFQSDLSEYNALVAYWNKKGGAPDNIYSQLEKTRISLDKRRDQLIATSKTLNIGVDGYNSNLNNLEKTINSRKNLIITQGLYKPAENKIEIFTFGDTDELRLVFMHELGHAIGLDHATDKNSIMYYLLDSQSIASPALTSEDIDMIRLRCNIKSPRLYRTFFERFRPSIS